MQGIEGFPNMVLEDGGDREESARRFLLSKVADFSRRVDDAVAALSSRMEPMSWWCRDADRRLALASIPILSGQAVRKDVRPRVYPTSWLLVTGGVLLGLSVGSFLNVVIHRLPRMLEQQWRADCAELAGAPAPAAEKVNLVVPRSACPHCGHRITALENIPIVSYLALRGKCSACKARISARYPAVEALSGLVGGYVMWRYGMSWARAGAAVYVWMMIALA